MHYCYKINAAEILRYNLPSDSTTILVLGIVSRLQGSESILNLILLGSLGASPLRMNKMNTIGAKSLALWDLLSWLIYKLQICKLTLQHC